MKPGNPVVFKLQITHNLLMAFAAFLFATAALNENVRWKRWSLYALVLLASVDVLFLVRGRTGQLVLLVLTVYFCARHFGWRGLFTGVLAALVAVASAWYLSSTFRDRVVLATAEYEHSKVASAADLENSVGLRMEWYRNTLRMIAQRPIFGAGTGGFPEAYAAFVTDPVAQKPAHPHNQYLMTAAEMGLVGVCALLAVFIWLWKSSVRIPDLLRRELVRGLILTFAIGCLFNSLLIDHTEGLFFVWMLALSFAGVDFGGAREAG
jgi:O-antigen ligase